MLHLCHCVTGCCHGDGDQLVLWHMCTGVRYHKVVILICLLHCIAFASLFYIVVHCVSVFIVVHCVFVLLLFVLFFRRSSIVVQDSCIMIVNRCSGRSWTVILCGKCVTDRCIDFVVL